MKKLLIVGGIILSFSAANLLTNESYNGHAQGISAAVRNDTTPGKRDSTRRRDTALFAFNTNAMDTVPRRDSSTRRRDSLQYAYATAILDTVPRRDSSSRRRDSALLAYNNVAVLDTTPRRRDSTGRRSDSLMLAMR